ncbi:hypothetical protein RJ639_011280 [Escallonia herrerae]|uniref:AAA+ ATPase domain-containing protein n=1 Tax=Escallonia herrerae TaxID=1293975 RepID=A0AA88VKN2_9ASTE|nr:hypothetical protein RJ639_011280 [Escallonia herrerae]
MVFLKGMPSLSSVFSAYAAMSASVIVFQTMFNQLVPPQVQAYVLQNVRYYFTTRTPSRMTLVIEEQDGLTRNDLYDAFEVYMCTKVCPNADRLKISKSSKEKHVNVKLARSERILDTFQGVEIVWSFVCEKNQKTDINGIYSDEGEPLSNVFVRGLERKHFELNFDKVHKDKVLNTYLPYVLDKAQAIKHEKKILKLHTLAYPMSHSGSVMWQSVNLKHPSTFEKVAMEPGLKKAVIEDLDRFLERKEFYRKVGKAWKRGYLLYGPPGTGKSSLIGAIANYLKFDIYDLQLMNLGNDSSLRKVLLATANRSILVIEDIDCSVGLPDRNAVYSESTSQAFNTDKRRRDSQFSLSGLLNFIDGLWSSCGDERIIIFTTNNKEKLDPALLRPGRMDMHIHMSYLTPQGFKLLASNYLDSHDQHPCFGEIDGLIESMKVSPAEVAEELMKSNDADACLGGLANFLKRKKMETSTEANDDHQAADEIELREAKRLKSDDH